MPFTWTHTCSVSAVVADGLPHAGRRHWGSVRAYHTRTGARTVPGVRYIFTLNRAFCHHLPPYGLGTPAPPAPHYWFTPDYLSSAIPTGERAFPFAATPPAVVHHPPRCRPPPLTPVWWLGLFPRRAAHPRFAPTRTHLPRAPCRPARAHRTCHLPTHPHHTTPLRWAPTTLLPRAMPPYPPPPPHPHAAAGGCVPRRAFLGIIPHTVRLAFMPLAKLRALPGDTMQDGCPATQHSPPSLSDNNSDRRAGGTRGLCPRVRGMVRRRAMLLRLNGRRPLVSRPSPCRAYTLRSADAPAAVPLPDTADRTFTALPCRTFLLLYAAPALRVTPPFADNAGFCCVAVLRSTERFWTLPRQTNLTRTLPYPFGYLPFSFPLPRTIPPPSRQADDTPHSHGSA